jgi:hypothetical protein
MWKRFDFAPIAIIEPKKADGTTYGENNIFRVLLVEAFGETDAQDIYEEALRRAQDASVVINPAGPSIFETYANGLSYPFIAPLTAEQLERGNALPLPASGAVAGFVAEWGKIRRIVRAVCDRFKGSYTQAKTAFDAALNYEKNGSTQTTGATDTYTHFDEYFRGGTSGASSTPTGRTATEVGTGSESVATSLGGFLDVWQGLGRFNDGEVVSPATIVVDAIFDALFVEYTPVGDVLVFGDQKTKLWGE